MGTMHRGSLASKLADLKVGDSLLLDATELGVPLTQQRVVSAMLKLRTRPGTEFIKFSQQVFYGVSPATREVLVTNKVTRVMP